MDTLAFLNMTDASPSTEGENIEEKGMSVRSVNAQIDKLGKLEGQGDNARPVLFVLAVEASKAGAKKPDDAEDMFDRYSKAVAATQNVGWKPQASAKQQTSKLRVALKLGQLVHVNGVELCNKIIAAQREQRAAQEGKNDYPPYDGLVKVARAQLKTPDTMLPDEVIGGLLVKPAGDVPEEADRLEKIVKSIENLMGSKEDPISEESSDALTEAAGCIMTRIKELGGSTAMRKQAAKLAEAAQQAQAQHAALIDRHRAAVSRLSV